MQSFEFPKACPECRSALVDVGDELVCQSCGVVKEKEVVELGRGNSALTGVYASQALGSYLGSAAMPQRDRQSKGFSRANSTYSYLKVVSDFAGREDGPAYTCERMIQRVGERLGLPQVVNLQAVAVSRKVLGARAQGRRVTMAGVSAYSLIAACKIEGITSVSVKEIVDAFVCLGRRVKASSIIQLSLESPIKTEARSPEEYLGRVLGRLSLNSRLAQILSSAGVPAARYFNDLRVAAKEVLAAADREKKEGHRPCTLAATSVYAAELVLANRESRKKRLTQGDVAACGDSAEYTVREQHRQIFAPVVAVMCPRETPSPTRPSQQ